LPFRSRREEQLPHLLSENDRSETLIFVQIPRFLSFIFRHIRATKHFLASDWRYHSDLWVGVLFRRDMG
ncbi:unnamed protein product, partial [Musa acuminata subsp. burmannicoides]